MEHCLVFTVFAKERDIFAEIHILEMISNETAITALDAFAKIPEHVVVRFQLFYYPPF